MKLSKKIWVAVLSTLVLIGSVGIGVMATTNAEDQESVSDVQSVATTTTDESKSDKTSEVSSSETKGKRSGAHVNVISVAASVLGKTEEEVKETVKTGKVGDLLVAAGKVDAFKEAYLSELKTKLDAAAADGKLTQEEADEKYAAGQEKMATYDGTTHLCGGKDHSKMFDKTDETNETKSA